MTWSVATSTSSADATRRLGASLARVARRGDVIVLAGSLGAGKTTFAQGFAGGLGIEGPVTSPTFTLVRQYPCVIGQLVHADLYRLESLAEVADLGIAELAEDGVALVEWGDAATPVLEPVAFTVSITAREDDGRDIAVRGHDGDRRDGVETAVKDAGCDTGAGDVGAAR